MQIAKKKKNHDAESLVTLLTQRAAEVGQRIRCNLEITRDQEGNNTPALQWRRQELGDVAVGEVAEAGQQGRVLVERVEGRAALAWRREGAAVGEEARARRRQVLQRRPALRNLRWRWRWRRLVAGDQRDLREHRRAREQRRDRQVWDTELGLRMQADLAVGR